MDSLGGNADIGRVYSSKMESAKSQNVDDTSGRIASLSLFQLLNAAKDHERDGQQNYQVPVKSSV